MQSLHLLIVLSIIRQFMELEELIERCKRGERQAQSLLYKRYSRQMLRICFRFVPDRQIAQDLMHDGFILIFASISSLRQPMKAESWMRRIMTNLALRYINQNHSVTIIPLSDLSEEQEPLDEEPKSDSLSLETLLMMIEKLPEGYRNVFKLSILDGLSHKEIAELLQIAPHSSSSQFYRAKEYLKKIIAQYYYSLLILIVLLLPIWLFIVWEDTKEAIFTQRIATTKETNRTHVNTELMDSIPVRRRNDICQRVLSEVASFHQDSIILPSEEMAIDTVKTSFTIREPNNKKWQRSDNKSSYITSSSSKLSGWTLSFEYNGGRKYADILPKNFRTFMNGDISSAPIPAYVDNWNDYHSFLLQYGNKLSDQREFRSLMDISQRNNGQIKERKQHYLPLTMGVLLHKSLGEHWGIETGLNYTCLVSDFTTGNDAYIYERQKLQYIGIPLRGTYLLRKLKQFSVYSTAGLTLEISTSATLKTEYIVDGNVDYSKQQTLNVPFQWSVNGGLGIQYHLNPTIGIFAEPNLYYYFNDGSGLKTIRKEHSFGFSLPIGIRFSY